MALPTFVCPDAKDCRFYLAWQNQFGGTRLDIIEKDEEYFCVPLETFARRRDIPLLDDDSELKKLVSNLFTVDCYYIENLNNQIRI